MIRDKTLSLPIASKHSLREFHNALAADAQIGPSRKGSSGVRGTLAFRTKLTWSRIEFEPRSPCARNMPRMPTAMP